MKDEAVDFSAPPPPEPDAFELRRRIAELERDVSGACCCLRVVGARNAELKAVVDAAIAATGDAVGVILDVADNLRDAALAPRAETLLAAVKTAEKRLRAAGWQLVQVQPAKASAS